MNPCWISLFLIYSAFICQHSPDADTKIPLFGRALRSEVKLDPLELLGSQYKVKQSWGRGAGPSAAPD